MKNCRQALRGQGFLEYALIIVLAVLAVIMLVNIFGINVKQVYTEVVCALTGSSGSTVFQADKGWGLNSSWQKLSGGLWKDSWATSGEGYLIGNTDQKKAGGAAMLLKKAPAADFVMNVNLGTVVNTTDKNPNATVNNGFGMFFRATDSSKLDGYSLEIEQVKAGSAPCISFKRWENGVEIKSDLAKADLPAGFDMKNPGALTLSVTGDTFTASLNGIQVLQAKDSTYKDGQVGLFVDKGSTATFKDMQLASTGCGQ